MKILEVHANDELITHVRYHAEKNGVESEGYCHFSEPKLTVPFAEVTEEMVIGWVEKEIGEQLYARLDAQAQTVKTQKLAPWLPQIFEVDHAAN